MRSGLFPTRISITATIIVEMPFDFIGSSALFRTSHSSSWSWAWISSCSASQRRAIARMADLAEAVGDISFPGLNAAIWRIRVIGPLIRSSVSRSLVGALLINVFKVTIACVLDFTALSRVTSMCQIISDVQLAFWPRPSPGHLAPTAPKFPRQGCPIFHKDNAIDEWGASRPIPCGRLPEVHGTGPHRMSLCPQFRTL